jgi:subfamily B ATP-binding cassette protein HlyB/CyaB
MANRGQKQRLAIARAVLKRARVLVFDEAASSLDAGAAEQLAGTINQLKGQATMLYIAHVVPRGLQVNEVMRLCEKVAAVRLVDEEGS